MVSLDIASIGFVVVVVGLFTLYLGLSLYRQGKEHYKLTYERAKQDLEKLKPKERKEYINARLKELKEKVEEELNYVRFTRWLDATNPARALFDLAKEYGIRDKNWKETVRYYWMRRLRLVRTGREVKN